MIAIFSSITVIIWDRLFIFSWKVEKAMDECCESMTPNTMTIVGEELDTSYKNIYIFFTFTPYKKLATHAMYFRVKNMRSFSRAILMRHKKIDAYCYMLLGKI